MTCTGDDDPPGHAYPAVQLPVQAAEGRPLVAPYVPPGQSVQTAAPAWEYVPAGQTDAVALVDPAAHAYPAVQFPVHDDAARPDDDPYRPASQGPLQAEEFKAVDAPYLPLLQLVQVLAPTRLYCPGAQATAVLLADPAGHA